ncbi:MAG: phosphomannomutase/phosphoglucomutase [Calditrichota bacterium]
MNRNIFREYDIRGIVGKDLTPEVVFQLGQGFGTYFRRRDVERITLGRDGRLSSPDIRDHMSAGILATGVDILDLGIIPTPLSYYSTHRLEVKGAVMITGSHNPPDYNGFKVSLGHEAIYGSEIQKIYEIIASGELETGNGHIERYNIIPEYLDDLASRLKLSRSVRIAMDIGNGVAGLTAAPLFHRLGCDAKIMFGEVDGNFPNHHPDPTVEANLAQLKQTVIEGGCELGLAFDGDGDRIGVVDEKGGVLWGDQILAILARSVLKENPGAGIIAEVKCSQLLFNDIEKHGGKPEMWKVGHSLIKSRMRETGALLAGEMSGHIFFQHRYYGFDDAVYVAGRLLEIVADSDKPVSRFLEDWPKLYNTPEIRLDCPDDIKFEVVARVLADFRNKYRVVDVDGMRVMTSGGWGLLRASNTQPVCVLRFEADSPDRLEEIKNEIETAFKIRRDELA